MPLAEPYRNRDGTEISDLDGQHRRLDPELARRDAADRPASLVSDRRPAGDDSRDGDRAGRFGRSPMDAALGVSDDQADLRSGREREAAQPGRSVLDRERDSDDALPLGRLCVKPPGILVGGGAPAGAGSLAEQQGGDSGRRREDEGADEDPSSRPWIASSSHPPPPRFAAGRLLCLRPPVGRATITRSSDAFHLLRYLRMGRII